MHKLLAILLTLAVTGGVLSFRYLAEIGILKDYVTLKTSDKLTIEERLEQFGTATAVRLAPHFQQADMPFPPSSIALLAFKDSNRLELYATDRQGAWRYVRHYPILAASGLPGPKLREGDRQVPEGIYDIDYLNPNSLFHVSMKLSYPNAFDLTMAQAESRTDPGSNIMIHGKAKSIGCLAMGDAAAEELFALTAWVGKENVRVVIAPTDFRLNGSKPDLTNLPTWADRLYQQLRAELIQYPRENIPHPPTATTAYNTPPP